LRKSNLISVLATALILALLLAPLALEGFPTFRHGRPSGAVSPEEVNRELAYLIWEDRFPDMVAQATLVVLAATACISAIRLWRGGR